MPMRLVAAAASLASSLVLSTGALGQSTTGTIPDGGIRAWSCEQVNLAAAAGFPWVSVGTEWKAIEPNQGDFQPPEHARAVLQCAKDLGLNTQLIITGSPQWASGYSESNHPPTPANVPAYAATLGKLAEAWAPLVDVWTPWNEPNFDLFWARPHDAGAYVNIQKQAYAAIKPKDPMSRVSAASVVGTPTGSGTNAWDYLEQAYQLGLKGSADIVMINFYPRVAPEGTSVDSKGRPAPWALSSQTYMRALVDQFDPGRPIWIGETGYSTCRNCYSGAANSVSEAEQADYTVRMYQYRRRYLQGVTDRIFLYETVDAGSDPRDWWLTQGIYHNDLSPKPVVAALNEVRVADTTPSTPGVGGSTPTTTPVPTPVPTLPTSAAKPPAPANSKTRGIRVAIRKVRVTYRSGVVTVRTGVLASRGRLRVRVDAYQLRRKRWRRVKLISLRRSSNIRVRFRDQGYVGVRVLARPTTVRKWTASRVVRIPAARRR
ncbi:MAG: hypothetical protein KDC36_07850 [Thermoleophilia bacterium]|nr:hypothetical protein [Thermoleophilia bacterium]